MLEEVGRRRACERRRRRAAVAAAVASLISGSLMSRTSPLADQRAGDSEALLPVFRSTGAAAQRAAGSRCKGWRRSDPAITSRGASQRHWWRHAGRRRCAAAACCRRRSCPAWATGLLEELLCIRCNLALALQHPLGLFVLPSEPSPCSDNLHLMAAQGLIRRVKGGGLKVSSAP